MIHDFDVHVCLVSDQAAPNLLPVLDPRFAPKSRRILMLVTPEMKENAVWLAQVFQGLGLKTDRVVIDDSYDLDAIQEKLFEYLDKKPDHEKAALNVTGGTKIMALAAHSVFTMKQQPVFYVREDSNTLIIMPHPESNEKSLELPINSELTLTDYLNSYGYKVKLEKTSRHVPEFALDMINDRQKYEMPLAILHQHAHTPENKKKLSFLVNDVKPMYALLELCKKHNLLDFTENSIKFTNRDSRKYVCGGWLEAYVQAIANSLPESKMQTRAEGNLKITKNDVENELDGAFMAKDTLHVIECKTGRLEDEGGGDVLYKLSTVVQQTGLRTKRMLVTYRNLDAYNPNNQRPHSKRAREYGIKVIEPDGLPLLKEHLQSWIAE